MGMVDMASQGGPRVIGDEELAVWGKVIPPPELKGGKRLVAHKVRVYPKPRQEEYLVDCVDADRYAFNRALDLWQQMYRETGKASAYEVRKALIAEKSERSPWLCEVAACVVKNAVAGVGDAFARFFAGQNRYPKFKKRKGKSSKRSFKADNGPGTFSVRDRGNSRRPGLRIPLPAGIDPDEFGLVKMAEPVRFDGELRGVVISQDPAGRWFASIAVAVSETAPPARESQAAGGVDLGARHLVAESDGTLHPNPEPLKACQKKRARLQRQLARRTPGSGGWLDTKKRLGRVEAHIADLRSDATHKATRAVADRYSTLGIETLNVAGMLQNKRIAATLHDAAIGETRRQLVYKSHWGATTLVRADMWFPSSKRCGGCGTINDKLKPEKHWTCPCCGARHHRDANSAVNLKKVAEAVTMQVGGVPPELTRMESTAMPPTGHPDGPQPGSKKSELLQVG